MRSIGATLSQAEITELLVVCRTILHRAQLRLGHRTQRRPSWSGDISTLDIRVAAPRIGTPVEAPQEAALLSERCAPRSALQPESC